MAYMQEFAGSHVAAEKVATKKKKTGQRTTKGKKHSSAKSMKSVKTGPKLKPKGAISTKSTKTAQGKAPMKQIKVVKNASNASMATKKPVKKRNTTTATRR